MHKVFSSKLEVLKLVKQHNPKLDINASCKGGFYVAMQNGKAFYDPNLRYWLERLNTECGMKFDQHMSRKIGRTILIYAQDGVEDGYLELAKVVKEVKAPAPEKVVEVVEPEVEVVEAVEEPKVRPISELDMEYATEFKYKADKKSSKKALDLYAEEFGIKLNGRKSIENMLKDLAEHIK